MDWYSSEEHTYVDRHPHGPEHDTLKPYGTPIPPQHAWDGVGPDGPLRRWGLEKDLAATPATASGPRSSAGPRTRPLPRSEHRRMQQKPKTHLSGQRVTPGPVLLAAIAVSAACLLGWSVTYTYGQLHATAASVLPTQPAQWWPLFVYGPWLVAALSLLRAAVQHQPAPRSWGVLLVTSAMAVAVCTRHSSHSALALVTLGAPPITALVCLWELVGQLSFRHCPRAQPSEEVRTT